jgi:hypothetical protein
MVRNRASARNIARKKFRHTDGSDGLFCAVQPNKKKPIQMLIIVHSSIVVGEEKGKR